MTCQGRPVGTHVDLLNTSELIPSLVHEWFVDRDTSSRDTPIDRLEFVQCSRESRLKACLLCDVRLKVESGAAKLRAQRIKSFLVGWLVLDVPDGDVATHATDRLRNGETNTLGSAGYNVVPASQLERRSEVVYG